MPTPSHMLGALDRGTRRGEAAAKWRWQGRGAGASITIPSFLVRVLAGGGRATQVRPGWPRRAARANNIQTEGPFGATQRSIGPRDSRRWRQATCPALPAGGWQPKLPLRGPGRPCTKAVLKLNEGRGARGQGEPCVAPRGVEQSPGQADVAKEIDKNRCQGSKSKPLNNLVKPTF